MLILYKFHDFHFHYLTRPLFITNQYRFSFTIRSPTADKFVPEVGILENLFTVHIGIQLI